MPEHYHPVAGVMSDDDLRAFLANIKMRVDKTVAQLPAHRLTWNSIARPPPARSGLRPSIKSLDMPAANAEHR